MANFTIHCRYDTPSPMKDAEEAESWRNVVKTLSEAIRETFPDIRASGDRHECARQTAKALRREVEQLRKRAELMEAERNVARAECEGVVKDLERANKKLKPYLEREGEERICELCTKVTADGAWQYQCSECFEKVVGVKGSGPGFWERDASYWRKHVDALLPLLRAVRNEFESPRHNHMKVCDCVLCRAWGEAPNWVRYATDPSRVVDSEVGRPPKWIKAPWEADQEGELKRPVVQYSASKEPREGAFWECAECRAKSGSPELCPSCLHNQALIEKLWGRAAARAAEPDDLDDMMDGRLAAACTALNEKLKEASRRLQGIQDKRAKRKVPRVDVGPPMSLQRWLDSYEQCNDGRDLCELPESSAVLEWLATTPPSAVLRALLSAQAGWVPDGVEILLSFRDDYQRGSDGYMAGCVKKMERHAGRDGEMAIVRCAQTLLEMGAVALPCGPAETLRRWVRNQRACTEPDWRKDVLEVLSPMGRNVLSVDEVMPLLAAVNEWVCSKGNEADLLAVMGRAFATLTPDWKELSKRG